MKTAIGCFIGLILSVSIGAESLFEGQVRLESGEPIADAQVRLFDLTDLRQGAIAHAMTDGTGYFSLPLAAMTGRALPQRFALGPNYPNPFNPSTIIPYQLTASSAVRLEVFNLLGQRIATLVDGEQSAGSHTATWHATDAAGRAVGAGVYIYRMTVGAESQTGRMVLIDGQAGVSAAGAASSWSGVSGGGEDAQVYGLIVSGSGLVPYVDSSFRVESGMAPVELVVSPGQYSAGKTVDFGDLFDLFNDAQEEEANETQEGEAETDSTSSEGGPDLIVQSPSVNHSILTPGQAFTLHVTVHNQGDEQAAATMLHYYRSNNATITASDTEVGTDAVDILAASATSVQSIELMASVGVERYYGACVTSVRGESNTDNNCSAAVKITVDGQVATEDSTETKTDPADSTATTQTDDIGGSEEPVQADSTSVEALDDSQRFNIELVFLDEFPAFEEEVIKRAANYWEVRLGDIPEFVFDEPHETGCYASEHRVQYEREDSIDDLTIFIAFLPRYDIATGRGGGLIYRDSGLPAVGCVSMKPRIWDENYHPFLGGPLHEFWVYNTTVHEIGHVLGIGIGPNWYAIETIENNQLHFPGPNAIEKFNQLPRFVRHDPTSPKGLFDYHTKAIVEQPGGTLYTGHKVPLTSDGGHWGEPLGGELMADAPGHWVDSFPKLSTVTLGALADMGYPVHYELAFPFWVDLNPPRGKPVVSALLEKQFLCGVGLDP